MQAGVCKRTASQRLPLSTPSVTYCPPAGLSIFAREELCIFKSGETFTKGHRPFYLPCSPPREMKHFSIYLNFIHSIAHLRQRIHIRPDSWLPPPSFQCSESLRSRFFRRIEAHPGPCFSTVPGSLGFQPPLPTRFRPSLPARSPCVLASCQSVGVKNGVERVFRFSGKT